MAKVSKKQIVFRILSLFLRLNSYNSIVKIIEEYKNT